MEKYNKTYIWIRIIGIPAIGIMMPLFFYDGDDTARLIMWMIISMVITFLFWEVGRRVSNNINTKYPINTSPGKHLVIMLLFFSVLSAFAIIFIFFINILFGNVSPDYWYEMKGIHIIIILITFFITAIHEGIFLFFKWKNSLFVAEKLEKENILANYEALKNQVNPHFLFNSMGVLSSLIQSNTKKALEYIDKFSKTYRYILDVIDKEAVSVKEEMEFINSYIYLQKISFSENLQFSVQIENPGLSKYILPLSIQIPVENAIKHNEISDKHPLMITICEENNYLVIKNNLNFKKNKSDSQPIGLKNLTDRYKFVTDFQPRFYVQNSMFIAEIPFISGD